MKYKYLELNGDNVIGKLDNKHIKPYLSRYKRIGGFRVQYLKEFIEHLNDDDIVGVYRDRKGLVPMHSNGWLVCPRKPINKKGYDSDLDDEGRYIKR